MFMNIPSKKAGKEAFTTMPSLILGVIVGGTTPLLLVESRMLLFCRNHDECVYWNVLHQMDPLDAVIHQSSKKCF
jgi:hypothetical protein